MKYKEAKLLVDSRNSLGEGPVWDQVNQQLIWLDIDQRKIQVLSYPTLAVREILTAKRPSALTLCKSTDGFLVAMEDEIVMMDRSGDGLHVLSKAPIRPDATGDVRFNDGKCDKAGRFWVGDYCSEGHGFFYSFSQDKNDQGEMIIHLDQVQISNGMAWTSDDKVLYYIDSMKCELVAFDFDLCQAKILNKRHVMALGDGEVVLDGMCIDQQGMLWIAMYGQGRVNYVDPIAAEIKGYVDVDCPHVTCPCLGGPDMRTLFVTTAGGPSHEARTDQGAGGLYSTAVEVPGVLPFVFK